jgi:hypothetical protein
MKPSYTFFEDPGHGWMEVPVEDLQELGVDLDTISDCSYHNNDVVYLEEDCDAGIFMEAYKTKYGELPKYNLNYNGTFIRNLESVGQMRERSL